MEGVGESSVARFSGTGCSKSVLRRKSVRKVIKAR